MNRLFLAVLIAFGGTPSPQVLDLSQSTYLMDVSCLIRIKVKTAKGYGMAGCSGTFIGRNTVLSAAHCFDDPNVGIWVRGYRGGSHRAKVTRIDFDKDLALLSVIGPAHMNTKRALSVRKGEKVINVGSPFGLEFLVSEGIVATTDVTRRYKGSFIATTGMINPGSSGGGAFNENNELIGVNTMSVGGPFGWNGITLAVDLKTIGEFLK